MKKNQVYFVLYIVLITELLIVIQERDFLEAAEREIRDKMLTTIAAIYVKDVYLTIPQKESDYTLGSKNPNTVQINAVGLYSDEEKQNIIYKLDVEGKDKPKDWPNGGISNGFSNDYYNLNVLDGNAIFESKIPNTGDFNFVVIATVERILPTYLPEHLLVELKHQMEKEANGSVDLNQTTNPETFKINVKQLGGLKKKEARVSF